MYTIRPDAVHSIWLSMSQALDYIHSRSIRHCDVKPENIFLKPDGKNAVLCDFGHAVAHPLAKNEKTLCYIPSEFLYRKSSSAGNVWALGVTMLYVAGLMPLPNRSWIIAHIGKGVNAEPEMKQWFLEIAEIIKKNSGTFEFVTQNAQKRSSRTHYSKRFNSKFECFHDRE